MSILIEHIEMSMAFLSEWHMDGGWLPQASWSELCVLYCNAVVCQTVLQV
jgi:hypothetical protein